MDADSGVNVVGYFRAEVGVGEAARLHVQVLEAARVPHAVVVIPHPGEGSRRSYTDREARAGIYNTNILCVNADQLRGFVRRADPDIFHGRYTIGSWFWEVQTFPDWMRSAASHVDEIWVASRHTAAALAPAVDKPVSTVPLPVVPPAPHPLSRRELGLPEGFLFLYCFDFWSVVERKNPLGLIDAYTRAFTADDGARLVLKSINGAAKPEALERVRVAAGRPDIVVLDGRLDPGVQHALVEASDAYVSLHRAEGFGLTIAEAMALGKPAIATGYSGNLEFMDEHNSYLVPYELVPIPSGCDPYPAGSSWAEPDVEAAASLMRRVFEDPHEARARGERAREDMLSLHGPEKRAPLVAGRLEEIRKARGLVPTVHGRAPLARRLSWHARERLRRLLPARLKRALARLLRPADHPREAARSSGRKREAAKAE